MIVQYFVYILLCKDNTLYTGFARNLEKRVDRHNKGEGAKYTAGRRPVKVVYSEKFDTIRKAMIREREIKKLSRKEKLRMIEK